MRNKSTRKRKKERMKQCESLKGENWREKDERGKIKEDIGARKKGKGKK